jgi:hypothetical protein
MSLSPFVADINQGLRHAVVFCSSLSLPSKIFCNIKLRMTVFMPSSMHRVLLSPRGSHCFRETTTSSSSSFFPAFVNIPLYPESTLNLSVFQIKLSVYQKQLLRSSS